jgi:hypothetical protein
MQGVVPRTCLSTRPVKPRPVNGQGPNGQPRGNPPPGMRIPGQMQGRPQSPAMNNGQRSQSPYRGPQQGRPMTPTDGRPMTPNGRNSPSGQQRQERRITPPGPSPMNPDGTRRQKDIPSSQNQAQYSSPRVSPQNSVTGAPARKPVPGQAM